ncbi:predicted protein [Botrytis cinerea T4]|uniref:Uncharacterized protein n=1 Tax=Botryotinia fuckeliana (strain T4) TaxID=999810 RepID=G2YC01_BOTF4|nr:predicted protein [Botrytis cinerea T4]
MSRFKPENPISGQSWSIGMLHLYPVIFRAEIQAEIHSLLRRRLIELCIYRFAMTLKKQDSEHHPTPLDVLNLFLLDTLSLTTERSSYGTIKSMESAIELSGLVELILHKNTPFFTKAVTHRALFLLKDWIIRS